MKHMPVRGTKPLRTCFVLDDLRPLLLLKKSEIPIGFFTLAWSCEFWCIVTCFRDAITYGSSDVQLCTFMKLNSN